ncbi:receptor-like protein EIX2 [Corylus avellana]|uniref:receptor-like protein EIX2 n=1 Tax=Corylus avellana TaxID=13451 RepID=UPI001E2372CA|nr:receptor-like protein EIX2 [Corylus avellana]
MGSSHIFMSTLHLILFFFFSLLATSSYLQLIKPVSCTKIPISRCSDVEREALLSFKYNLTDQSGRLSSWVGEDCCNWIGVGCDNNTGNVVKLDLRNPFVQLNFSDFDPYYVLLSDKEMEAYNRSCLGGKISSSLLNIKHLSYFDLSFNNFNGISIPKFLGSLENLRYLNLSFSLFSGVIPSHIGNLSRLQSLDLNSASYSTNFSNRNSKLEVESLEWLVGFSSLKYLGMDFVNLEKVPDWVHAINVLPSLRELHLAGCELVSLPHSISSINFTLLSVIDLSFNDFNSFIPQWLSNVSGLSTIKLETSLLRGTIPIGLIHLANLHSLNLADNQLSGEITEFVDGLSQCSNNSSEDSRNFPSLQELDLSFNQMNGTIPESIGKLARLVSLNLFGNSWEGVLTEAHFQNLTQLKSLRLSVKVSTNSTLVLKVKQDWVPPFKLIDLKLTNMRIGPTFPTWLKTQNELNVLWLENAGISDTIPHGLWKSYPNVTDWNLSHNKLRGQVPYFKFQPLVASVDLRSNKLEGPLPLFHNNLRSIFLGNNMFSGPIPKNIGELLPNLNWLDLSSNSITGRIPHSIGMLKKLGFLILRNNFLSGRLPPLWKDLQKLTILDIAENNISGNVPSSMQYLRSLEVLSLSQNHLDGEFPSFFRNYKNLQSLDLGRNKFSGKLPTWLGESLPSLLRLSLRSNLFQGDIPQQLCLLSNLQILDLAHNDFSGVIPQCLGSLRGNIENGGYFVDYDYQIFLVTKGIEYGYGQSFFNLVYSIDLSSNNLSGEIPDNITGISELVIMNLSMNHLTGRIPKKIGNLHMLETLDLSMNELCGPIPESLSSLTFLSHLNLSFNNLSGKIPSGNQLQTLNDSSIYEGNSLLSGPPLSTKCSEDGTKLRVTPNGDNQDGRGVESFLFWISMVAGFIVGFWGVCGTLIIKTSWRQAYFRSFDNLKDKIAVFVMVKIVCLLRKVKSERN